MKKLVKYHSFVKKMKEARQHQSSSGFSSQAKYYFLFIFFLPLPAQCEIKHYLHYYS